MRFTTLRADLSALLAGAIFSAGLGLSGMTRPAKVLAFLDITGDWDPSLALVMVGAIGLHALAVRFVLRRDRPLLAAEFHLPTRHAIDGSLLAGALIFGVGWGLGGYCPGPAVASLVTLAPSALIFVAAMCAGLLAGAKIEEVLKSRDKTEVSDRVSQEWVG